MKSDIHPNWYPDSKVTCACGATFTVGSTMPEIHVEVCGNCHPFYTGEAKYIDTMGRVERFQAKQSAVKIKTKKVKGKTTKPVEEETPRKTLQEIMAEIKSQPE